MSSIVQSAGDSWALWAASAFALVAGVVYLVIASPAVPDDYKSPPTPVLVAAAAAYLVGGGIIYLVLWIYGLVIDKESTANFVPVNTADNWLHLVLGVGMIGLGLALSRDTTRATA